MRVTMEGEHRYPDLKGQHRSAQGDVRPGQAPGDRGHPRVLDSAILALQDH